MRYARALLCIIVMLCPVAAASVEKTKDIDIDESLKRVGEYFQAPSNSKATYHLINIPSQNVAAALNILAKQTEALFMFPYDIAESRQANEVVGRFTIMEALKIILRNSGLASDLSEEGVVKIYVIDDPVYNIEGSDMKSKKNLLAGLIGLFVGSGVQGVVAQEESSEGDWLLEEVIVTAQKREERLIDVPISISAISGEDLENSGIQNIADLAYAVPSLSVRESGPGRQTFTIRGVGNIQGDSPLVGIYLDEMPISAGTSTGIDLQVLDLKQVEVLRGPQGTLYGQSSVGGTVRFITNDPSFDGIEGNVGISIYDTEKGGLSEELTGVLNIPIIDDKLGFRISGTYKDKSGWIDQPAAGQKDINDNELSNIRIKGLWQLTDDLSLRATIIQHRNEVGTNNTIPDFEPVSNSNYVRAVDPTVPNRQGKDDYDLYNLSVGYDFSFATLTSTSSWVDQQNITGNSSQFILIGALLLTDSAQSTESFTQEIRLTSNGNAAFNWTLGTIYSDKEGTVNIKGRVFDLGFILDTGSVHRTAASESIAVFGDVSYDLTDQLTLGVGTRYFEDDKEALDVRTENVPREASYDDISSRFYLSYAMNNDANLYMSISEGFRSGGLNVGGADPYDPEQLIAYEFGVKANLLDRRLKTELAIFYSEYSDYLSISFDSNLNVATQNVGVAEIKGVEWNIEWLASQQLSIGFNGTVTETEFTKINSTSPTPTNIAGDPLPGVPKYSYSVNAMYSFDWSSIPGFFRLTYNRQGETAVVDRGAPAFWVPEHRTKELGFLNAQLGAQWTYLTVELFASNLLDEDNLLYPSQVLTGAQHRPRTVGLKVGYAF